MEEYKLIIGDKEITLSPGVTSMGRASDSDILLEDRRVSLKHAQIELIQDKLFLKDLNSLNGTFINGSRIRNTTELKDGDEIQIIIYKFKVKMPKPKIEPRGTILDLSRPCPKCGERVSRSFFFCPHCGSRLELAEVETTMDFEEAQREDQMEYTPYTKDTLRSPREAPPVRKDISATGPTIRKEEIAQPPVERPDSYVPEAKISTEKVYKDVLITKKPAGFWLRFVAYLLDIIFINLISLVAIGLLAVLIFLFFAHYFYTLVEYRISKLPFGSTDSDLRAVFSQYPCLKVIATNCCRIIKHY